MNGILCQKDVIFSVSSVFLWRKESAAPGNQMVSVYLPLFAPPAVKIRTKMPITAIVVKPMVAIVMILLWLIVLMYVFG